MVLEITLMLRRPKTGPYHGRGLEILTKQIVILADFVEIAN